MADRPRRRQKGTGAITRRGERWVGRIDVGYTRTGGRRRVEVSGATRAEVVRKLRDRQRAIEAHGAQVTTGATVKSWSVEWLDIITAQLRPKTVDGYRTELKQWIVPTIGHRRLDQLTPGDVRAVATAQRKHDRAAASIRKTHVVLIKMLKDAAGEGRTVPTPVLAVRAPGAGESDRLSISTEHARAILATARNEPAGSRWYAALLQGLRQAEALGLEWDRVNLDRGLVDISWQLQAVPYRHGCDPKCGRRFAGDCPKRKLRVPDGYAVRPVDGALCLVRPKTAHGQRFIPLTPIMVDQLAQTPRHGPLVWPSDDGRPRRAADDRADWYALQERAGVAHPSGRPWLLHECRHTTATLLLELRVDPVIIEAILGHASITTSRDYMHVSEPLARAAMEGVSRELS